MRLLLLLALVLLPGAAFATSFTVGGQQVVVPDPGLFIRIGPDDPRWQHSGAESGGAAGRLAIFVADESFPREAVNPEARIEVSVDPRFVGRPMSAEHFEDYKGLLRLRAEQDKKAVAAGESRLFGIHLTEGGGDAITRIECRHEDQGPQPFDACSSHTHLLLGDRLIHITVAMPVAERRDWTDLWVTTAGFLMQFRSANSDV